MKLRALGLTCGIGSMVGAARNAGFKVVGNVEWRKYYHAKDEEGRNTFLNNFPGAFMVEKLDECPEDVTGIDLVLGHPECGNFSLLNSNKSLRHDAGDIPLFIEMVAKVRPRYFVMDDLPKSFIAYRMENYCAMLPEYDLFPEWVSNYHYGNIQKQRKRFFMIGALKTEKFVFKAGEFKHERTVEDEIKDLLKNEGKFPNHDKHVTDARCAKGLHLKYYGHEASWGEMRDYVLEEMRCGAPIRYHTPEGDLLTRVGSYKGHWDGPAHVLTGGISGFHPLKGFPYTIRERARIQGFPDDFIFYGTKYDEKGKWSHDKNIHMVKQTGKAMPWQFNEYVSRQIKAHIEGKKFKASGERFLPADPYVDQAKLYVCENGGYSMQVNACNACWMRDTCHLSRSTVPEMEKTQQQRRTRTRSEPKPKLERVIKIVTHKEGIE